MDTESRATVPGDRLILSAADTAVERELIERWASTQPGAIAAAEVIELDPVRIQQRLARGDDPLLVPVRITWLPPEREGEREAGWSDLLTLDNPRNPRPRSQSRIVERDLDRYRVIVGEPARVSELRRRFLRHSDPGAVPSGVQDGPSALGAFVFRQATLALERAERAVIGDRYKVPRLVVEEITTKARYHRRLADLAEELELPVPVVADRAIAALQELIAVQSRLGIDLFGTMMRPLHARGLNVRVQVDELDRLRELNRRSALIFLPSHRSYADTLVLADALHLHNFPRNHVVSGDNLALWPFAPLARRAGIVFIRRSFRDDEIYKLAIQEYFGYLVSKRFNLEWYFEGGRSRTGKLRAPRFGLLAYVADALAADPGIEVQLVPVSITYERLHEVSSMAAEQRGVAKQREGLGWLARYARAQRRAGGDAVVRFGAPVNMRRRLADHGSVPGLERDPEVQREALNRLAFDVAVGINRATPVLPAALVTLALLGVRDRALTLEEVRGILEPVLDYVEARSVPESGAAALRQPGRLAVALAGLERSGLVTVYAGGDEPVYSVTPGQHLVAAFYRNNSVHWFVNRAIVELVMIDAAERVDAEFDEGAGDRLLVRAWAEALSLRDQLKHEFFFPETKVFRDELVRELELIEPQWLQRSGERNDVRALLASSGVLFAPRVLSSFVEAQLVVAKRLAAQPADRAVDRKSFLAGCAGTGQQMLLQGLVRSEEALSGELFGSALALAQERGLLEVATDPVVGAEISARRAEFAARLSQVAARIRLAAEIDAGTRSF